MITGLRVAPELAPFLPYCFLACYVAFVLAKPTLFQWLSVTAVGLALDLAILRFHPDPWVYGLGLAAAMWAALAPLLGKKTIHPAIVILLVYPAVASIALLALHPQGGWVLDRYLLAADGSLGLQPGFLMAAFLLTHPALRSVCDVSYFGLAVALVCFLHTNSARQVVHLTLLLAGLATLGFLLFPAVGAHAAFPDLFPFHPPPTSASSGGALFEPGNFPRNFMPSMHAAWGIALLLGAWPLGRYWRAGAILYLLPMLSYTIASHYLFDLVVAIPWAFAARSLLRKQWRLTSAYAAIAAAWLVLIRFGLPFLYISPVLPWTLILATAATPAILGKGLSAWARKARHAMLQEGS